ncbi:MAG TPA: ATP-binding cassette domain-containing protein [Jatrophihabitans sp.]|jgi:ABC-type lipoprotein export system ATPase subunit|uniref:ABC transporter ATP-binding protein n=1 Tax=Jatrophihabitans sp. TaxID=1932789 RepID=UPI002F1CEC90
MTARGLSVSAHGLVHIYRLEGNDVVALTSVDLEVPAGQLVGLLGPSGSGKSTLITLLAGVQRPSAGRLRVGEHDLAAMEEPELDRLRAIEVGAVLQGAARNLLSYASPAQNVAFAQKAARRLGAWELPRPVEVLDLLSLADCAHHRLAELTPGQLQRLAVAVGMATLPGLLLADEPTSQLDHRYRDEVLQAINSINRSVGTTVITVTHDPEVAARMPRTITIRDGRIGAEGHGGEDFAVLGRDGSLQLPPDIREQIAPGTLLRVQLNPDGTVLLDPRGPDTAGRPPGARP